MKTKRLDNAARMIVNDYELVLDRLMTNLYSEKYSKQWSVLLDKRISYINSTNALNKARSVLLSLSDDTIEELNKHKQRFIFETDQSIYETFKKRTKKDRLSLFEENEEEQEKIVIQFMKRYFDETFKLQNAI
uniref:hypothetical protein n=1 Tax=uncultured Allobacillus sp. TaxID=1638025 RepID=UPI0025939368|nr:hypothetical protein [uncultured Allobacillus sp.]